MRAMRCCKALRAATTPHQAVDRSWADVQVIGKLLHCENTLRSEGEHLNDGLCLRGSRLPSGTSRRRSRCTWLSWSGTVMPERHAVEDIRNRTRATRTRGLTTTLTTK